MKPKIILAGGSGFLGQALAAHFRKADWEIVILGRSPRGKDLSAPCNNDVSYVGWDASTVGDWQMELDGATAVVNLTGRSVNCRYNERNRREILDSRVNSTRVIGQAIGRCAHPPGIWLNASTATVYRHTFGEPWDEHGATEASTEAKDRFSVEVAWAWEQALQEARTPHTRKVALRMAMVLGQGKNSVFPVLRRLTRLGLGGRMGSGRQYVSWIHEADYSRAIEWLITHNDIQSPVNLTAPNPLPNAEMMGILREIYHMPFGLPATEWMLEIGAFFLRTETELLIKSRRVIPGRLLASGFNFQFANIQKAFENLSGV